MPLLGTDPVSLDSLCAAVAQSAATIVAIVGGFILSQLLSRSSERGTLRARLQDIGAQLLAKKEQLRKAEARLLRRDASELIVDALGSLVKTRGQYPLAEAMAEHGGRGWDEEELRPYWLEAVKTIQSAYRLCEEHPEWLDHVFELERRLRSHGLDLSWLEERIYLAVFLHEEPRPQESAFWGTSMRPYAPIAPTSEAVTLHALDTYSQLVRDVEAARAEVGLLETQAEDLRNRLCLFVWPAGLGLGFAVLGYCALTGILFPLVLMALPPRHVPEFAPWLVVALFASGLVAFFVYLGILVRKLARMTGSPAPNWLQRTVSWARSLENRPPAAFASDATS